MNKRNQISMSVVGVLVLILSFFIVFSFLTTSSNLVSTQSQDLACRALISASDKNPIPIKDFFSLLEKRCFVDKINSQAETKNEVFQEVGDSMSRCWYRYGEGQHNFLANTNTEGSWCFQCARIDFEETNGETYSLEDFVDWSQQEETQYEIENNENPTYYEYMNFKYANVTNQELRDIEQTIKEFQEDQDANFEGIALILDEQYKFLQDLRLKKIDTSEELYVVYRFDRLDKTQSEQINDAVLGAGIGIVGGIAVVSIAETALMSAGTVGTCTAVGLVTFGVGGIVCGVVLGSAQILKNVKRVTSSTAKLTKLASVSEKIGKSIKLTKKSRTYAKLDELATSGSVDDIADFSLELKEIDRFKDLSSSLDNNVEIMRRHGITHVDEIHTKLDSLTDAQRGFNEIRESMLQTNNEVGALFVDGVSDIARKNAEELRQISFSDPQSKIKLGDLARGTLPLAGAVTGAVTGYNINFDENQYVDIMSREQYYRLCGTEPIYREN